MTEVFFNNIQAEILSRITSASKSIRIAVSWFTNNILFNTLNDLLDSGIDITIITMYDEINCNKDTLDFNIFISKGGKLFFCNSHLMHNKFCIIDNYIVISGSYNWTYNAESSNLENVFICKDNTVVLKFIDQFEELLSLADLSTNYQCLELSNVIGPKTKKYLEKERINKMKLSTLSLTTVQPPLLIKDNNAKSEQRLCNLSIGTIYKGKWAGKKYVHAMLCFKQRTMGTIWVDIIDDEFVNDIRQYFHEKDGGLVDDSSLLKPIPKEIYDFEKYKFNYFECYFEKGEHSKISEYCNKILVDEKGKPYLYNHFFSMIRYDEYSGKYSIYSSIRELCRIIIESLFDDTAKDDIFRIARNYSCSGIFRLSSEDDISSIEHLYNWKYGYPIGYHKCIQLLQSNPKDFWASYSLYSDENKSMAIHGNKEGSIFFIDDVLYNSTLN